MIASIAVYGLAFLLLSVDRSVDLGPRDYRVFQVSVDLNRICHEQRADHINDI